MASVTKLTRNGKIVFRVKYKDALGKERTRQFPLKRDAERFKAECVEFEESVQTGDFTNVEMPFEDLAGHYMHASTEGLRDSKDALGPQTLRGYQMLLENHILQLIGDMDISDMNPTRARELRDTLINRMNTRRAAQQAFDVAKGCFSLAVEREWLKNNPLKGITVRQNVARNDADAGDDSVVVIPSREEIAQLSETALYLRDSHTHSQVREAWQKYCAMYFTFLMTGMRAGEVRALRWRDVDFDARKVLVRRAADSHTSRILEPKRHSRRAIPLSDQLAEHLKYMGCPEEDAYIFAGVESGKIPAHSHIYNRMWKRLLKTAEVKHYRLHALRHYYVSLLITDGVDHKRVSSWAGHKSVAFTLDTYGHLIKDDEDDSFHALTFY